MKQKQPRNIIVILLICALTSYSLVACLSYDPNFNYLSVLQSGAIYDNTDSPGFPEFSYQASHDPALTELRRIYNLNAVAGNGDEFSKITKLLKWVHEKIPHNGNIPMPVKRDALSILKSENTHGQNCRILAIVMNEVLLAMGYKSRFITCYPRDYSMDCHVVVVVYLNTLNKWIFIDPSYEAWFTNEDGALLGLDEIRQHLIENTTLVLNWEANYNGDPLDLEYLHYLSKNLYWFESPLYSSSGCDSKDGTIKTVVRLVPKGYKGRSKSSRVRAITTSNPSIFWQKP